MYRPSLLIPACLPLFLSFACSGSDGETTTESTGTNDDSTAEPTTAGPSGAPVVMELLSNAPGLTENEGIVLTAVVVDPDGLDTIVGGKLTSEDGSAFYGAFAHIGGGTFQIAITWAMIGQTEKIEFLGPAQQRLFKADFFDVDGNHGYRTLELSLTCKNGGACASQCVYISEDTENCGKCGNVCMEGFKCIDGDCYY